ncbi:MAG: autotransporter outer membrane beta-barrel domain-containing protein [Actinobacillus minor]|nr:autotransporter outer membrane beta-barrel domain-containing protein [Actinobacillus minor]
MKSMNLTKFSSVYTALFIAGVFGSYSSTSYAYQCNNQNLIKEGSPNAIENGMLNISQCNYELNKSEKNTSSNIFELENSKGSILNSTIDANAGENDRYFSFSYHQLYLNNSELFLDGNKITLSSDKNTGFGTNTILRAKNNSHITINNSTLNHTTPTSNNFSVLDIANSTLNLSNSNLINHKGTPVESSFYVNTVLANFYDSNITIANTSFDAQNDARIIYSNASTITISDSQFKNSLPKDTGLLAFNLDNSNTTISNSSINLNNASRLFNVDKGKINIENSNITNKQNKEKNSLFVDAILSFKDANVTIKNTNISSEKGSGLIFIQDGNLELNNVSAQQKDTNDGFVLGHIQYGNNTVTINDSNLTAERAFISVMSSYSPGDSYLNLTLNNTTVISDTLHSSSYKTDFTANNSLLSGQVSNSNANFTLRNTEWNMPSSSSIRNLSSENVTISIGKKEFFSTLTINENLTGNTHFTLNTDIAKQRADRIVVNGTAEGEHNITVQNSGAEPNEEGGRVTLVEINNPSTALFSLKDKEFIDLGAFRYHLDKEGNNWVLLNRVKTPEPVTPPVEPTKPVTPPVEPVKPVTPSVEPNYPTEPTIEKALSEKSNALVSLRQAQLALVESNLEGLHQRLGELKNGEKGNVWVRNVNSRNDFASTRTASDSRSSGFEQDVHSVQLGADAALTDNIRLGGFVGNARSDVDFDGEYGSGKVKTQSLGLYGTYLANNGFYWDNVAKYEYVKSESASTGKRKYNAYTLSTEVGRIHQLGQGWTVTPQIQAAWTRLSSQSDEERLSALTARAGVRVAKAIEFDGWKLQPYAEVNGITTQTNQSAVRVNQYLFDVAESKGRIQTALGINAAVGNHRLGLEGSVTNGKYLDQPYKVQAVYRYSW